jgi:hypothetical protein
MADIRWQPIQGEFVITGSELTFRGGSFVDPSTTRSVPKYGLALTNRGFGNGNISLSASFEADAEATISVVLAYDPATRAQLVAGLEAYEIGIDTKPSVPISRYVIALLDPQRSSTKDVANLLGSTPFVEASNRTEVNLRVRRTGSTIDLFDHDIHVLRSQVPFPTPQLQSGISLSARKDVRVFGFSVSTQKKSAFIVMQFGAQFDHLYQGVIRPIAEECGYEVNRADELPGSDLIIADISRQIRESDVVIADVTPENANVFYEVGYAHALGKPTILLAERGRKLPFDVSGFRTLFYDNSIGGKADVERHLKRHLQAVAADEATLKPVGAA